MKNIAVIGAGTMGNGIAHVFAQFGYRVNLIDVSQASLDKAIATIGKNLDRQLAKEAITESEKQNTLLNLTTFTSLIDGVKGVDLVVEAATENIDLKLQIFKEQYLIYDLPFSVEYFYPFNELIQPEGIPNYLNRLEDGFHASQLMDLNGK